MIYSLLGYSKVDYVSKKTNKRVTGFNIYLTHPIKENGEGYSCETFYVGSSSPAYDTLQDLILGSEVEIYFDRYGNIIKICEV